MLALLGFIPTILTTLTGLGTSGSSIAKSISDAQIAKEKTKSDARLKELDVEIAALHDRKDVLVAEAGSRLNASMRFMFAIGPMLYVFKYYAIDKFLGSIVGCAGPAGSGYGCGLFRTDGLNPEMAGVLAACIGFYFVTTAFGKK